MNRCHGRESEREKAGERGTKGQRDKRDKRDKILRRWWRV